MRRTAPSRRSGPILTPQGIRAGDSGGYAVVSLLWLLVSRVGGGTPQHLPLQSTATGNRCENTDCWRKSPHQR